PRRDVPRSLIRAGIVTVLAYGLVISVILFTLPKDQLSNATGFLASISLVNSVLPSLIGTPLGWVLALGIVLAVASSGGAWIIGADRTYAIASLDRTAPSFLGRFSGKYGTPIAVNTMSGIMATIAMLAAILINSYGSSNIQGLFTLVLGFTISTTTLSYLFVFPAYLRLKHKYPHIHRPYSVPGGIIGGWLVSILPIVYVLLATVFVLYPPDAIVALSGVSRQTYELTQLIPLLLIVVLTVVFYVWGQLEKRNEDVVVQINLAETELAVGD
ncbi:MAG: APC family permease, partial [Ktedonobacteraceae bacterium]